jgi:hypothetical protein
LRPKFNVKTMGKIFAMPGALLAGKKCFWLLSSSLLEIFSNAKKMSNSPVVNWLIFSLTYYFNVAPLSLQPSLTFLFSTPIFVLHNSGTRLSLAPIGRCFQALFFFSQAFFTSE